MSPVGCYSSLSAHSALPHATRYLGPLMETWLSMYHSPFPHGLLSWSPTFNSSAFHFCLSLPCCVCDRHTLKSLSADDWWVHSGHLNVSQTCLSDFSHRFQSHGSSHGSIPRPNHSQTKLLPQVVYFLLWNLQSFSICVKQLLFIFQTIDYLLMLHSLLAQIVIPFWRLWLYFYFLINKPIDSEFSCKSFTRIFCSIYRI